MMHLIDRPSSHSSITLHFCDLLVTIYEALQYFQALVIDPKSLSLVYEAWLEKAFAELTPDV